MIQNTNDKAILNGMWFVQRCHKLPPLLSFSVAKNVIYLPWKNLKDYLGKTAWGTQLTSSTGQCFGGSICPPPLSLFSHNPLSFPVVINGQLGAVSSQFFPRGEFTWGLLGENCSAGLLRKMAWVSQFCLLLSFFSSTCKDNCYWKLLADLQSADGEMAGECCGVISFALLPPIYPSTSIYFSQGNQWEWRKTVFWKWTEIWFKRSLYTSQTTPNVS